jgi:diguanylate cyclase (GGDEF)-like protein
VDNLKAINDAGGHAAGDQMLLAVAEALQAQMRSYDLIFRYGGDEFVCVVSGVDAAAALERLDVVNTVLADADEHGSVTVGVAQLQPGDTPEHLVARADAEMYRERHQRRGLKTPRHTSTLGRGSRTRLVRWR